ncbi:MAG: radical SAM protein [Bacteroidetes bacterium]|nr:radical SAM protein [Bacteroidota bacterium]
MENLIFGSVPSRRLGRSIGVNNIPHKVCSYSCAYCQIGKAKKMQVKREDFYHPDIIVKQIEHKFNNLDTKDLPDYITIVPDGEPTLDVHLGELIVKLKTFGFPVAVITNSSLIDCKDVQAELMNADYISIKVDTVNHSSWKRINKPHRMLNLESILKAIQVFSKVYTGKLVTETMLIKDVNDTEEELVKLTQYLQYTKPDLAYIATPTRPTAFKNILPADEATIAFAYKIFTSHSISTELLNGYEGNAFASSGNFTNDILSITAVHPMRRDAVLELMAKSNATEERLNILIDNGLIKKINFNNQVYYLRNFRFA